MPLTEPPRAPRLNPKKLLLSKWTAVQPQAKEKHYIVTQLLQPPTVATSPSGQPPPIVDIVIEAVHSGRSTTMPWRELTDTKRWRQGWR